MTPPLKLGSSKVTVPDYCPIRVPAKVIRRSTAMPIPVRFFGGTGYMGTPVYIKIDGIQMAAVLAHPIDEPDICMEDIDTSADIVWSPDGIEVKSVLYPAPNGWVELEVSAG